MKKIINNLFFFITIIILITSCKKPVDEKKQVKVEEVALSQEQLDSLHFTYIAINDSLDANWTVMIQDDDEKIANMKLLLKEVSKTRSYNQIQYDSLTKAVDNLSQLRYNRRSMADSDKIDTYDSATSTLTKDVILYAANHPQYKDYPQLEEIINKIQEADNRVIIHRIRYDRSAKNFNGFVQNNQKHILQIDSNSNNWKEVALFELPE